MVSLQEAIAQKYLFKPYSKKFKKIFSSEKKVLKNKLKEIEHEIHHIGSTSVEGLGGKGIIDIIVVVEKKAIKKAKKILKELGFTYDHTLNGVRSFHYKYYSDKTGYPRLIHLHLTFNGSGEKEKALAFRNHLKSDKKAKKEYERLKKLASKKHSKSGEKYRKFKEKFIIKHLNHALKEKMWEK